MTDLDYMALAVEQAGRGAESGEIPVGAVLVKDGKILSLAHNLCESRRLPTAHAEMLCIEQACLALGKKWLSGATLYVTLEPCPMCTGAILNARLDRVVFALADPKSGCLGSLADLSVLPFNHKLKVESGLLADEVHGIMRAFFLSKRSRED